jgi:hypothetical protein
VLPTVRQAIEQVRRGFPDHDVQAVAEAQGGAYVVVDDLPIGEAFVQKTSWLGFLVGFQYPRAHVYPHWLREDLARNDGGGLQPPLHPGHQMPGFERRAVMLSRASNRWDPAHDTAALKLERVLLWLREAT